MSKPKTLTALSILAVALMGSAVAKSRPDWNRISQETVELLADYVRVDTTNPPGNEDRAARFFGGLLEKDGIEYKIFESAPGRASIYARLKGNGHSRPLILLNHMDVVPADRIF